MHRSLKLQYHGSIGKESRSTRQQTCSQSLACGRSCRRERRLIGVCLGWTLESKNLTLKSRRTVRLVLRLSTQHRILHVASDHSAPQRLCASLCVTLADFGCQKTICNKLVKLKCMKRIKCIANGIRSSPYSHCAVPRRPGEPGRRHREYRPGGRQPLLHSYASPYLSIYVYTYMYEDIYIYEDIRQAGLFLFRQLLVSTFVGNVRGQQKRGARSSFARHTAGRAKTQCRDHSRRSCCSAHGWPSKKTRGTPGTYGDQRVVQHSLNRYLYWVGRSGSGPGGHSKQSCHPYAPPAPPPPHHPNLHGSGGLAAL